MIAFIFRTDASCCSLLLFEHYLNKISVFTQLLQFDKALPFPNSLKMLREVEDAVYSQATLRTCHFKDITVPLSRSGVGMINVWQDLKAVTYDLFQIASDLLNDGDHALRTIYWTLSGQIQTFFQILSITRT